MRRCGGEESVALDALHVEIAAIEAVSQVIDIVEHVALRATRLIVDLDLIHQPAAFNLELRV